MSTSLTISIWVLFLINSTCYKRNLLYTHKHTLIHNDKMEFSGFDKPISQINTDKKMFILSAGKWQTCKFRWKKRCTFYDVHMWEIAILTHFEMVFTLFFIYFTFTKLIAPTPLDNVWMKIIKQIDRQQWDVAPYDTFLN